MSSEAAYGTCREVARTCPFDTLPLNFSLKCCITKKRSLPRTLMLKLGQTVGVRGRLSDLSFSALTAPRLRIWSVSVLRNKTTNSLEQIDVGTHHGKMNIEMSETKRHHTASHKQKKYSPSIQVAMDAAFGKASGGALGFKFDAFVDELLADCSKSDISNFIRIAGKRSRNNTALHMIRRLPDISRKLDSMASSVWSYREISNIIYGLQCCRESDDGYLAIMSTMSKIATRTAMRGEMIQSQSLSMLLYGLRSNKFKRTESRELLSSLHKIAVKCKEPLDAQAVGNALYGLQGMSSDDADVRSLVRALSGQVQRCSEPLSAQNVGNALYGLQGMSSSDEGRCLGLCLIRTYIDIHKKGVSVTPECLSSSKSVVMIFPLLKDHLSDDEVTECERITSDIDGRSHAYDEGVDSSINLRFQSRSEQRMHTAAVKSLGGSKLRVSHNEHLFGLFECDVVIRVPRAVDVHSEGGSRGVGHGGNLEREELREEQSLIINIEVDGVHHRREKKKRFCRLRDEYLQSRGVVIARIGVSALGAMSEHELEEWVLDVTAKALLVG